MPVCIGGMHRSGTSMVANLLRLCGLHLGPESEMLPAALDNPEGYWENVHFRNLNDEILGALGGAFNAPPRLPPGWHEREILDPVREKAKALFRELPAGEPWGWKDPRNSLTLPFWLSLLPQLKVIICVRHPFDVASSERRRWEQLYASNRPGVSSYPLYLAAWKVYDRVAGALSVRPRLIPSYRHCFNVWKIYNQKILAATGPENRLVTHYDSYFVNPEAELRRIFKFLSIRVSDEQIGKSCSAISPELRHHRSAARNTSGVRVPHEVADLYSRMCEEARFGG
jgi:hypothetical protein